MSQVRAPAESLASETFRYVQAVSGEPSRLDPPQFARALFRLVSWRAG